MRDNRIRARWARGEVAYGTILEIPSSTTAYVLAQAGYDWVIIEQQHAFTTQDQLLPLLHALETGGSTAVVRVGENDANGISRALDLGARGVIVPMVNTADQAAWVVANVRFPPVGERSWSIFGAAEQPADTNDDLLALVMSETVQSVDAIDDILAVPGLDGVVFGAADMALSMGLPPRAGADEPAVWQAFEKVGHACRRQGKHLGAMVGTEEMAARMVRAGADFVTFSADLWHVERGVAADVAAMERLRATPAAAPALAH